MFDTIAIELQRLEDAPTRARELSAERLTARCKTGHVEATGDGLRVVTAPKKPFMTPEWAAEIDGAVVDAVKGVAL